MQLFPLLKRDWYGFRRQFIMYLCFWIIIPTLIHILLAIPLSRFISLDVRYLNWAAAGVWVSSAGMASFLESSGRMKKIIYDTDEIEAILKTPVTNLELITVISIRGVIFGLIQFIFAILITCTLNNEYLGIMSIMMILIQILAIILFFSVFGTFVGLIISNRFVFIQFSFLLFFITTMGIGTFIPLNSYPDSFIMVVSSIPLTALFQNLQSIIIHDSILWGRFFLSLALTAILFIISLIISHKIFRKI